MIDLDENKRMLKEILTKLPNVESVNFKPTDLKQPPLMCEFVMDKKMYTWFIDMVVRPLEPREAEFRSLQLCEFLRKKENMTGQYAIIIAPYVSPSSAELLKSRNIGFCDFCGNCYFISPSLFIERAGFCNKYARHSTQRSLYTKTAERILRTVLDPHHNKKKWTVRDLSATAYPCVSQGMTQRILELLKNWRHVQRAPTWSQIIEPEKLLKEWTSNYRFRRNQTERYYSSLTLDEVKERILTLVKQNQDNVTVSLASLSAVVEMLSDAPRCHKIYIYWKGDKQHLINTFKLEPFTGSDDNFMVYKPYDDGVFYPGKFGMLPFTCPVQTYLDLLAIDETQLAERLFKRILDEWQS